MQARYYSRPPVGAILILLMVSPRSFISPRTEVRRVRKKQHREAIQIQ